MVRALGVQETAKQDLKETAEQLLQAQVQRDKNALRLQQLGAAEPSRPTTAEMHTEGDSVVDEPLDQESGVIEQHLSR